MATYAEREVKGAKEEPTDAGTNLEAAKERESAAQQAQSRLAKFKKGQNSLTPTGPTTAEAQLEEYTKIAQACVAGEAARLQHKAAKKAAKAAAQEDARMRLWTRRELP